MKQVIMMQMSKKMYESESGFIFILPKKKKKLMHNLAFLHIGITYIKYLLYLPIFI